MSIDWWTLALQGLNFLILIWLLRRYLYRPVLAAIDRRRVSAQAAFDQAEAARLAAGAAEQDFKARIAALADERRAALSAAHAQAEAERAALLERTRHESDDLMVQARRTLADERAEAERRLRARAAELAVTLAQTLLAGLPAGAVAESFLEQLERHLDTLPAGTLRRLTGPSGPVRVVTCPALDEPAAARWRQRLAARLGPAIPVDFGADTALVAGARLDLPAGTVEASWQRALDSFRQEVAADGLAV